MGIEYKLEKDKIEEYYPEILCNGGAIIKRLHADFNWDAIDFMFRRPDGKTFERRWYTNSLNDFKELRAYERLMHIPAEDIKKLAIRIYFIHHAPKDVNPFHCDSTPPEINQQDPEFKQILEELTALQATEKQLVDSGALVFPKVNISPPKPGDLW